LYFIEYLGVHVTCVVVYIVHIFTSLQQSLILWRPYLSVGVEWHGARITQLGYKGRRLVVVWITRGKYRSRTIFHITRAKTPLVHRYIYIDVYFSPRYNTENTKSSLPLPPLPCHPRPLSVNKTTSYYNK